MFQAVNFVCFNIFKAFIIYTFCLKQFLRDSIMLGKLTTVKSIIERVLYEKCSAKPRECSMVSLSTEIRTFSGKLISVPHKNQIIYTLLFFFRIWVAS